MRIQYSQNFKLQIVKTISLIGHIYGGARFPWGCTEFVKTNLKLRYFILCGLCHFHTAKIIGRDFEEEGDQIRQKCKSKVVVLFKPGTSVKTTSFYVASLWRYCRLIVWEGCDKLEGCDELEGTGEDPLQHWRRSTPARQSSGIACSFRQQGPLPCVRGH